MTPRLEELRRRLQALKYRQEMERVEEQMSTIRQAPIPNILLFRLLELEQQHLEAMRILLKREAEYHNPLRPSCIHNTIYRPGAPINDNRLECVK
jgi:hypothetical protein